MPTDLLADDRHTLAATISSSMGSSPQRSRSFISSKSDHDRHTRVITITMNVFAEFGTIQIIFSKPKSIPAHGLITPYSGKPEPAE